MLTGQDFGKDTRGTACVYSLMSGISAGIIWRLDDQEFGSSEVSLTHV